MSKELSKWPDKLGGNAPPKRVKGSGWSVVDRIWKDVGTKNSDMFVWIICSRDLSGISNTHDLERIVNWKPLAKRRLKHAYKTDREFLATIDTFLQILQHFRPFSVSTAEIETNGDFPSTYHFRICEFAPG